MPTSTHRQHCFRATLNRATRDGAPLNGAPLNGAMDEPGRPPRPARPAAWPAGGRFGRA